MLYINIWSQVLKSHFIETLIIIATSTLLFFVLLDSGELEHFQDRFWPQYKNDYYFTATLQGRVEKEMIERTAENSVGVESVVIMDSRKIQSKLLIKLRDQGLKVPRSFFDKPKTYLKVFLSVAPDNKLYLIAKNKFLSKLVSYSPMSSEVKVLRKSLNNERQLQWLKSWGAWLVKGSCFIFWYLSLLLFSVRTKKILLLCEEFKFQTSLRAKKVLTICSVSFIFSIGLKIYSNYLLLWGRFFEAFICLICMCFIYYISVMRSKLSW